MLSDKVHFQPENWPILVEVKIHTLYIVSTQASHKGLRGDFLIWLSWELSRASRQKNA